MAPVSNRPAVARPPPPPPPPPPAAQTKPAEKVPADKAAQADKPKEATQPKPQGDTFEPAKSQSLTKAQQDLIADASPEQQKLLQEHVAQENKVDLNALNEQFHQSRVIDLEPPPVRVEIGG